jgi:hypothetical protein
MINITHKLDPAGITPAKIYQVDVNTNILDWLNDTFESQDDLCGELACSFWLNGKEIFRNDHDEVDHSLIDLTLGVNDSLVIINRPAISGAVFQIVVLIISLAVSVYTYLNMPKLPGAEEAGNESPNNRLNAASNQFRPGQGIPECFGFGVSYPDFIQPSFYFYENNVKKVIGVFCATVGAIEDNPLIRVGDTDITTIPESSADVYGPFVAPPAEFLTIHQATANVDGQELVAPNDNSLIQSDLEFDMTEVAGVISILTTFEVVQDLGLSTNSNLYLRSIWLSNNPLFPGTPGAPQFIEHYALDGVFEIIDIVTNGIDATITFSGSYSDQAAVVGSLGRASAESVLGEGTSGELDYWIGFFDTPGEEAEAVFIHWQAPTGVRKSGGGTLTLTVRFEIENVDTAVVFALEPSITKNTFDPQFVTTVFNKDIFPAMTTGHYKVRARRITDVVSTAGTASEQLKVEAFVSVTPYTVPHFGDVTTVVTQRRATLFSPDQSGQKINLDYRRKLPFYNRGTDTYETGNLQATKAQADAAAYTLIVKGNETEATVNLSELYAIQDGLSDQRLGAFTFTFDDADLSKGERVESICNSARISSFHDGQQWRFARDESKPIRSAMFNRRSVTGNNAKQAWQPQRSDDADSVRILYVDPDSNTEESEERRFDINTGQIISGEIGIIPIEIKLAGCRDILQASNRADLEVRRIAHQRQSVRETTYREALEIDLLDRVGWVDINDIDTFDGEIFGIDGDNYDTSEGFHPEIGKDYVVFITDNEGFSSNTVPCVARLDTDFGFTAAGLSGGYIASGDEQISSRYFIADADDLTASNFTLKARTPNGDGTVEIELVEYNELMYEMD